MRRQGDDVGIGPHIDHHRPVGRQGEVERRRDVVRRSIRGRSGPASRHRRRSRSRAHPGSAAAWGTAHPRSSHDTMLRSRLFRPPTKRGSDQRRQYLETVISAFSPSICIAPSPTRAKAGRSGKAIGHLRRAKCGADGESGWIDVAAVGLDVAAIELDGTGVDAAGLAGLAEPGRPTSGPTSTLLVNLGLPTLTLPSLPPLSFPTLPPFSLPALPSLPNLGANIGANINAFDQPGR